MRASGRAALRGPHACYCVLHAPASGSASRSASPKYLSARPWPTPRARPPCRTDAWPPPRPSAAAPAAAEEEAAGSDAASARHCGVAARAAAAAAAVGCAGEAMSDDGWLEPSLPRGSEDDVEEGCAGWPALETVPSEEVDDAFDSYE